jgi:putative endonuclease
MAGRTYYVYIMSSLSRTLYTGVTNDIERRVFEHKEGQPGSFTARYKVNRLVYFEEFDDIIEAIAREKEVKKMARRQKIKLIESMNPDWHDLGLEPEPASEESGIPRAAATRGNDNRGRRASAAAK